MESLTGEPIYIMLRIKEQDNDSDGPQYEQFEPTPGEYRQMTMRRALIVKQYRNRDQALEVEEAGVPPLDYDYLHAPPNIPDVDVTIRNNAGRVPTFAERLPYEWKRLYETNQGPTFTIPSARIQTLASAHVSKPDTKLSRSWSLAKPMQ